MHAWELQKGLFISVLKIDLLLRRDVESFRVASCSAAAAAAVVGAHVGGGLCRQCSPLSSWGKSSRLHPAASLILWGSLPASLLQAGFYRVLIIDLPPPPPPSPFMVTGLKLTAQIHTGSSFLAIERKDSPI